MLQREIEYVCSHCEAEYTIFFYDEDQDEPSYCSFCGEMIEEEPYIDGDESDDE